MAGAYSIDRNTLNLGVRVKIALAVIFCSFFVIALRLWYLQVLKGEYFRNRSENNLLRLIYVPAPRGEILDRNGRIIADNRPAYNIDYVGDDGPQADSTLQRLAEVSGMPLEMLRERMKNQSRRRRFEPKLLMRDIDRDLLARIAVRRHDLPGVAISVVPTRRYVTGEMTAHVVGYLREITREQLESSGYPGYRAGEMVGQYGIEREWEAILHGETGVQAVIVNAAGQRIGERSSQPEHPGHNLVLTIDMKLQEAAFNAMQGVRGGIVALDPETGEVLAMVSAPSFDPNVFSGEVGGDAWRELTGGRERRLSNRVTQGEYHPGSVFKIHMALAGLIEGAVNPQQRVFCPGHYFFGGRAFKCHKHAGHGSVDLRDALVLSCDVYFYTLAHQLGIDRIHRYATALGLGEPTGLEWAQERPGLIPSPAWKRRYFRNPGDQKWYPGETISVGIGQGAVTVTPLQLARSLAAIVNGGKLLRPYIERKITRSDGETFDDHFSGQELGSIELPPRVLNPVKDALVGVVSDARGTGRRSALPPDYRIQVAGKTGTAQVGTLGLEKQAQHLNDHAWFAAYAPADKPKIVVVALIENGGHGGAEAAPRVRQVMEAFFGVPPKEPLLGPVYRTTFSSPRVTGTENAAAVPAVDAIEESPGD